MELLRLVRVSPSLSSIAVLNAWSKTIMNRYGERGSPLITPVLVISHSGVNTTADMFTYNIYNLE